MKHSVLKCGTFLMFFIQIFTGCSFSNGTDSVRGDSRLSFEDSMYFVEMNKHDPAEMREKRKDFGQNLSVRDWKLYHDRSLSKAQIRRWMLHMNAVYGMTFDNENEEKFLNGRWSMYRLDTLEHRLVTIERHMNRGEGFAPIDEVYR